MTTVEVFTQSAIKAPLTSFRVAVGRYPTTEEGLVSLVIAPESVSKRWTGPYIAGGKIPRDPWGREYQYQAPGLKSGGAYDVWSLGPDGVPSSDDVGNWQK